MEHNETAHLVSMANDIAANLSFQADADAQIASHISRFWTPRMRRMLLEFADSKEEGLSAGMQGALKILQA